MVLKLKKIKLNNKYSITWLFLFLFLCMQFALNGHTIFSHITYILFVGMVFVTLIFKKFLKIYYTQYFNLYILFMLYNFILVAFGLTDYGNTAISRLIYMFVNLIFYIALYNFIIESSNRELLFKITVYASVLSLIFIMVNVEDIWTGRLGHTMTSEEPSFYVYGIPLYLSGNSISTFTDIGALFSLYLAGIHKKRIYFITYIFLAFGTLLSGSRKGLLLLVLFTVFAVYMYFKGANWSKTIKFIILMIIIGFIIMRIPVFYNLIGKRTEALIGAFFGMDVEEASMDNRMYLASLAREYIYQKPILGWGLGSFSVMANSKYSVDNNYLDILVSCGVIGLFIYYSYVVVAVKKFFYAVKRKVSIETKTMFYVLLCFLILDLGSVVYNIRNQLMWVVIYFAFVSIDIIKNKKNSISD